MPDHFVLAVQWGFTVCGGKPICASFKIQPEFTIHGICPDEQPEVPIGAAFTSEELNHLPTLKSDWPDEEYGDESLWRHEYKDHGIYICKYDRLYLAMGLDAYSVVKYFKLCSKAVSAFRRSTTGSVSETVLYAVLRAQF